MDTMDKKRERERERECVFVSKKMGTKDRAVCVPRLAGAGHCVCACVYVCVCVWRAREDVEKSLGSEKGVIKAI